MQLPVKLQLVEYAERIIATSRESPIVCRRQAQYRTHCQRALPAKLQLSKVVHAENGPNQISPAGGQKEVWKVLIYYPFFPFTILKHCVNMYLVKVAVLFWNRFKTPKRYFLATTASQNIKTGRFGFVIIAQITNPAQIKIHIWRYFTNGTESSVR